MTLESNHYMGYICSTSCCCHYSSLLAVTSEVTSKQVQRSKRIPNEGPRECLKM